MNYREKIRKAIECPQFGNNGYGEWGALRYDQRVLIKRLLDELDSADDYILKMQKERQELIEYLKEKINECKTSQKLYHNHKMDRFAEDEGLKKRIYQEILSKIEKR